MNDNQPPDAALSLHRDIFTDNSTSGILDIDGQQECYTLEPTCRKQPGKFLAIGEGTYEVIMLYSTRFKRMTPHLVTLENGKYVEEIAGGRTSVEMHPGNFEGSTNPETKKIEWDSEACIMVGQNRDVDYIGMSGVAFNLLVPKIEAKLALGRLFIYITGGGQPTL